MALSNAERQRRYRELHQQGKNPKPIIRYRRPEDRRSRPQRWNDAVEELKSLQAEYQEWLDNLPEQLTDSALAEKLSAVIDIDLSELEAADLPKGFGRD
jgi:hypothetical protein